MANSTVTFEQMFHTSLAAFLRNQGIDAVRVTDTEDRTEYGGYCETCSYEYTVIDIYFIDSDDRRQKYTYSGDLGELMREL